MIYAKVETEGKKANLEAALKDAKKVYWYRRLKVIQLSSAKACLNLPNSLMYASGTPLHPSLQRRWIG